MIERVEAYSDFLDFPEPPQTQEGLESSIMEPDEKFVLSALAQPNLAEEEEALGRNSSSSERKIRKGIIHLESQMAYPCKEDPELFYSDNVEAQKAAKLICLGCTAIDWCLKTAIDNREEYGVWGGYTGPERTRLRRSKRRHR